MINTFLKHHLLTSVALVLAHICFKCIFSSFAKFTFESLDIVFTGKYHQKKDLFRAIFAVLLAEKLFQSVFRNLIASYKVI